MRRNRSVSVLTECDVLSAFASNLIGGADEHCGAVREAWPILDDLKAKGLIEQVWVLSDKGRVVLELYAKK
jgi:hypothetical protein